MVKAHFCLSLFCLRRMSHNKPNHKSFLSHSATTHLCGYRVRVQFGEQHSQHAFIVKAHYVHNHRQTQRHLCCCSPWWAGPQIARHNTGRWLLGASSQVCTQPLMSCLSHLHSFSWTVTEFWLGWPGYSARVESVTVGVYTDAPLLIQEGSGLVASTAVSLNKNWTRL